MRRHLYDSADVQIAKTVALHVSHSFAFEPEQRSVLRAGWDFDLGLAGQGGDFKVGAQSGLHKANGHFAEQIISVALEDFVRFDMQDNVEVARRPSANAR